ncbi:MAG TPA: recombinase family protein [Candidatus Saccharimonadales bacterium]
MSEAIAIRRVSSKKQQENNHSLEQQDSSVQNMAAVLDTVIVMEWAMATSAKKGKNLKRKDLQAALSFCRYNRKVKYLLIDKVSRFMRELEMTFYYKVEFKKLDVKLIFCDPSQQELNGDNAKASYELARKGYDAEVENEERSNTSFTKMKARVDLGYYPFYPHQGYKKTDAEDGLHVPDQPRYNLLKQALRSIANFDMTVKEALLWLTANGYRTPRTYRKDKEGHRVQKGNKKLDRDTFENHILVKPYYAGTVEVSDWPINKHGLHKAMITPEEHETIVAIVKGRKIRRIKKNNPDFPLNRAIHYPCRHLNGKIVGINHSNGKGWTRKDYMCRACKKCMPQELVHESLNDTLCRIKPTDKSKRELKTALRNTWNKNEEYRISMTRQLKYRLVELENKKSEFINTLSVNPDIAEDIKSEIYKIKLEIVNIKKEINDLGKVEEDFTEFLDYSLNYIENMRDKWWELPSDGLNECKQLLFQDVILVNQDGKVYTPELSTIFSLFKQKNDSKVVQNGNMVEIGSVYLKQDH